VDRIDYYIAFSGHKGEGTTLIAFSVQIPKYDSKFWQILRLLVAIGQILTMIPNLVTR
jgi:hypothetical protein